MESIKIFFTNLKHRREYYLKDHRSFLKFQDVYSRQYSQLSFRRLVHSRNTQTLNWTYLSSPYTTSFSRDTNSLSHFRPFSRVSVSHLAGRTFGRSDGRGAVGSLEIGFCIPRGNRASHDANSRKITVAHTICEQNTQKRRRMRKVVLEFLANKVVGTSVLKSRYHEIRPLKMYFILYYEFSYLCTWKWLHPFLYYNKWSIVRMTLVEMIKKEKEKERI